MGFLSIAELEAEPLLRMPSVWVMAVLMQVGLQSEGGAPTGLE